MAGAWTATWGHVGLLGPCYIGGFAIQVACVTTWVSSPAEARVRGVVHVSCYPQGLCRCPGSDESPETLSVSEGHAATKAILICVAGASTKAMVTYRSELLLRTTSGFMVLLQLRSVLMFMDHRTTRRHGMHACQDPRTMLHLLCPSLALR